MSYSSPSPPPAGGARSALLSGLRGQTPPSGARPSPSSSSSAGYPRLPPHTPQHRQRFPSSEHTLGPSFDDDDEDLEMVAKMAALNAGVYPYNGPPAHQQHRQQPHGASPQQAGNYNMSHMLPRAEADNGGGHRMQSPQGSAARRLGMGGGDANHPSSINYQQQQQQQHQHQQQQQIQQQELLRVLTMQTLASSQGPRNLEELRLLQALAQQQQQREMEQQVEQLLRMQVHQQAAQLQQQLIQQQQQAAMLAHQPTTRPGQQQSRMGGPPLSAGFDQRSFEQSYAHAQQQVQLAHQAQRVQQTPQQLASAYEQRHLAQQQIQANLRARSGVPALPTPAAVAASGHRFGFELESARDEIHGPGIFGNGTTLGPRPSSQPRGLSPQPGAGAVGERAQPSPAPTDRISSPLETGSFGGLPLPASIQQQQSQRALLDSDLLDGPVAGGGSLWTQAKSNPSGNWRTKATESPPPTHPRSVSAGVTSSPAVSRFTGTFSPPPAGHAREQSAPIARFQASHGLEGSESSSSQPPSRANSSSDDNEGGSRSPTSSEGPHPQVTQTQTPTLRWTNSTGSDLLKPIYEGIGLGRPYPPTQQHQQQLDKPASPTPPSTGYGGARSLSMAAAAAALNSHSPSAEDVARQQFGQRATPPAEGAHPRTRSYELGGPSGNVAQSFGSNVSRQPRGPPSPADELGARNFASRLRRKAGSNLSVLGRREQSASPLS